MSLNTASDIDDSLKPLCFVIMGFGKKTDYESGRTLDLNATYNEIIKPAAVDAGFRCIRADEVMHSGVIDLPMYEMLLRAELVIADITTGNPNAIYELGVRHALRPFSTIIMKEGRGKLYFDLNHVNTFSYDHLGEDIGASEARRAKSDLTSLINQVMTKLTPDSPVYTFLPRLIQPKLSDEEFEELIQRTEDSEEQFSQLIVSAEAALKSSEFFIAVRDFSAAVQLKPDDPYLLQQFALATYKSKLPTPIAALVNALKIITVLAPSTSNDPETLGITGAIHKRLWAITENPSELAEAVNYYGRGFNIRKDYYTGENYALCLNYQASIQADFAEKTFLHTSAKKVREQLLIILDEIINSQYFEERTDQKWVLATMANTLFGLGEEEKGKAYQARFYLEKDSEWEIETYEHSKRELLTLINS